MNYGKQSTEKKIKDARSNSRKVTSKLSFGFFKTLFLVAVLIGVTGASVGIGMIKGIAGITQNPSKLNPITGREANEEKRKVILQYMLEQGYIVQWEMDEALADPVYDRIQNVNDAVAQETATPYSYFTDELIGQVKTALMEQLGYSDTQAHNLIYSGGIQIYTTQDPRLQAIVDEEVNNPENYLATRYSLEYRLSVQKPDGETKHYSQGNIKQWHLNILGDTGFDALYDSEEEARTDAENYKNYVLQEGGQVIGESITVNLQPQVSFVLMDQKTGEVKAISGGRGQKTANLTLNRETGIPADGRAIPVSGTALFIP